MSESLSTQLNQCLHAVWKRRQQLHLMSGVLALFRWSIGLFLLGMFIDWMSFAPTGGRVIISLIIVGVSFVMAYRKGWKDLRPFNPRDVALQIEESMGGCQSLLVTATQLNEENWPEGVSKDMLNHTIKKAEELAGKVDGKKVVSYQSLQRFASITLVFVLIIGVFSLVGGTFLKAGITRLCPPWTSVKYPTRTQVQLLTSNLILKEGSESTINAKISGVIPELAKIVLRTGEGKSRSRELMITSGNCEYKIKSAYRDFDYRIHAGDDRSEWRKVRVISAPKIIQAKVEVNYPKYTLKEPDTLEALTLNIPEGSDLIWNLSLDRAVSEAYVQEGHNALRKVDVSQDGLTVTMTKNANSSSSYKFQWKEKEHGFTFLSPNNYLQVQPDQSPQVELIQPEKNLVGTLGRPLKLSFRARDDHGIGEANLCYRVNKIAEKKVSFKAPLPTELGEKDLEWDYREGVKGIEIGDTITFVIEMSDRYPGTEGPHVVRSQSRRLTILSEIDYLSQMAKQRNRLLRKVKNIYREEREVHILISQLDPKSENFIQSCQLEVVRQELLRERLLEIKQQMADLQADLIVNNFTEEKYTGRLSRLQVEIGKIARQQVAQVSDELRKLTTSKDMGPDLLTPAIDAANFAAREMGLMVLSLGFKEATEIMAREIDTIAADQARLKLNTIMMGTQTLPGKDVLSSRQKALSEWLTRLLGEIPKDRESRKDEAIVAFKLSRLSKDLTRSLTGQNMIEASQKISANEGAKGSALQAKVIKSLLKAEFRLRSGLEYSSLLKAYKILGNQADEHRDLAASITKLSSEQFKDKKGLFDDSQRNVSKELSLLLIPELPSGSYQLFDIKAPPIPNVAKALSDLETSLRESSKALADGSHEKTIDFLNKTEKGFLKLKEMVKTRINQLKESDRVVGLAGIIGSRINKIGEIEERLLGILEKTEDAEADETDAGYLAPQLEILAKDLTRLTLQVQEESLKLPEDDSALPLIKTLKTIAQTMTESASFLKKKEISKAVELQVSTLDTFEHTTEFLTKATEIISNYAMVRSLTDIASAPGPLLAEIIDEQKDMVKAAQSMKASELPGLAIPQKNLIHAVNAILTSLDPLSHQIETGSVMIFAKEDMGAASQALEDQDIDEAIDAGSFVAESMNEILDQLEYFSPQYVYNRELSGFLNRRLGKLLQSHFQLKNIVTILDNRESDDGLEKLSKSTDAILKSLTTEAELLKQLRGRPILTDVLKSLSLSKKHFLSKDGDSALTEVENSLDALTDIIAEGETLIILLTVMLSPPESPVVPPERAMVLDFLALATQQKSLLRSVVSIDNKESKSSAKTQTKLAGLIEKFITRYESLEKQYLTNQKNILNKAYSRSKPKLSFADTWKAQENAHKSFFKHGQQSLKEILESMRNAAKELDKSEIQKAMALQKHSKEVCRYFMIDHTLKFLKVPGPPAPADPAPSFDISTEDTLLMGAAGMVRGQSIKGGRLEWEVLGRRDRAALNENFARELPLEYRGLLKDYYERLAQ